MKEKNTCARKCIKIKDILYICQNALFCIFKIQENTFVTLVILNLYKMAEDFAFHKVHKALVRV